jgi:RimK family alpha-L-glutamate ligase
VNGHLSVVPDPGPGGGRALDLAIVADRLGWEEKAILTAARERGATGAWLDDGELCCGSREDLPQAAAYLIRSRSFVRGALIAQTIAAGGDGAGDVVNPSAAIDVCASKVATAARLRRAGIATVPYRLVLGRADLARALEALGAPIVIKPVYGGLGRRVMLVRELAVADSIYDYVEQFGQGFDRALIAQPYLAGAADVRVLAVGGDAVAAMERQPSGDWRANVEVGATAAPIELDDRVEALTREVAGTVGASVFGLDLFRWDGDLLVNEVNHSPLFRGIVDATAIDVGALIAEHVLGARVG